MIMNWIIFGVFFILTQQQQQQQQARHQNYQQTTSKFHHSNAATDETSNVRNYGNLVMATPLIQEPPSLTLNPFIKHWEIAKFDRAILEKAHEHHVIHRRRKRDINYNHKSADYGPANVIRFKFYAHDREFSLVLREDPSSVFATDMQIENTEGPVDYDVSRVYSGKLEDDENSYVHGILTADNLFDGTITTRFEQYYIEPARTYSGNSQPLNANVHSIIYKLSDVKMRQLYHPHPFDPMADVEYQHNHNHNNHKTKNNNNHDASDKLINKFKMKNSKLKVKEDKKYEKKSDEIKLNVNSKVLSSINNSNRRRKRWLSYDELSESQNPSVPLDLEVPYNDNYSINRNKNIHNSEQNYNINRNINNNNNRKILINNYNPNSDINSRNIFFPNFNNSNNLRNNNNSNINNNFSPSHKTHVEIITKNGSKKPNIIVNNYDPDFNLNIRNDLSEQSSNSNSHFQNQKSASSIYLDRKSTCMLYLQADHTFFQKMGSDEASIETITRHVQRANSIYKNTDFNGDGKPDNITFMIKRIKVHNMNALKDPTYRFPGNYGVEKFLELFSEEDYDAFCLAYMFTYRDFEMGTLGLAWTGDLKNAGGVCEKNGHYRGSLKSLNTGIVTLLNYGKHVPPAVSHVTLAHEIGHNFGSPHDPEQCTPGGEDGNFIMFARATSGDKRNNNRFSPCSLKAIEPVLNAKARSAKGCFTEPQQSICGNGVVEPGEQCDCGWEEDCKDSCCYPMSRHQRIDEKPCTLTPNSACSPSQGPCCRADCKLNNGNKCRDDNGCRDPSYCNGDMPQCPPSVNKPNKTICNKEFVCFMGECTGSICLAYGLESCQCIPGPNDLKTKSCELCCKIPGEINQCKSSFEWNEPPYDVPDMFAKPGTPCNDYNGYCDVFQKCREVDPSGPLATLRKLLLSEESIASFKKWVQSNWYAVSLIIAAVFALLILSTKLLGKRSNLKLKTVTIIHSATTETVRLPEDNAGVIVHTAVRTKVPLKKKVRGERSKSKSNHAKPIHTTVVTAPGGGTITQPIVMPNSTNVPTTSKDILHPQQQPTAIKMIQRQTSTGNGKTENPKKLLRKKKRVSAPVGAEEQQNQQQAPVFKPRKLKKSKSKHKEVIDYSNRSESGGANHTNTFGKVHKWLLESPIVSNATSQFEHASKIRKIMSKSQSTPEHLTQQLQQQRSPKKLAPAVATKIKTKSVGNINEKVKLQVVYKPPFKFSLKLSKNDQNVKTNVLGRNKPPRKLTRIIDKKRVAAVVTASTSPPEQQPPLAAQFSRMNSSKRAALLVRSVHEDNSEPNYETLNPKVMNASDNIINIPDYENVDRNNGGAKINTQTFRINKSASGSNINKKSHNSGSGSGPSNSNSNSNTNSRERRSSISHSNSNSLNNRQHYNSGSQQFGGSQQSLLRSSTTNLSSSKQSNRRSNSNSNLNLRRDNSSVNLLLSNGEESLPHSVNRSRKNSMSSVKNKNNISRTNSNSNLSSGQSTMRRGSISNIPRASLSNNFKRQTSMNASTKQSAGSPNHRGEAPPLPMRPHTSSCDNGNDKRHFEWPIKKMDKRDEPLPSDLEVMVSDVENLVNDDIR